MILPAFLCCALTQAVPLAQTALGAFMQTNALSGEAHFIGLENFVELIGNGAVLGAAGTSLLWVLVRVAAVAIVPPLLGWAAGALGPRVRGVSALALSAGWTLSIPAALALMTAGALAQLRQRQDLVLDPDQWSALMLAVDGVATLVLASGLGLLAYGGLAGSTGSRRLIGLVWVIGLLAAFASGWQELVWPLIVTNGSYGSATLAFLSYSQAFRNMDLGMAAAINVLVALPVIVAGVLIVLAIAVVRPALEPAPAESATGRGPAWAVYAVAGLIVLGAAAALTAWIVTGASAPSEVDWAARLPLVDLALATVVPPLITVGVQALVAVPAAFAIGRLRPLGAGSLWLLLLFAPFLLLTSGPLVMAQFQSLRGLGLLGYWFTVTDFSLNVPVLVLLTLYFNGSPARRPVWLTAGVVMAACLAVYQAGFFDAARQFVLSGPSTPTFLIALLQMVGRTFEAPTGPLLAALLVFIVLWWPLTGLVLARLRLTDFNSSS
jgi:hypothetical protein